MREDLRARLLEAFQGELEDHLAQITSDVLALEQEPGEPERLNSLFRAAHTLKGAARAVGLDSAEALCHRLESRLVEARDGLRALEPADLAEILEATDRLSAIGARLARGDSVSEIERDAAGGGAAGPAGDQGSAPVRGDADGGQPEDGEGARRGLPGARRRSVRIGTERLDALQAAVGMLQVERARVDARVHELAALTDAIEAVAGSWRTARYGSGGSNGTGTAGSEAALPERMRAEIRDLRKRAAALSVVAARDGRTLGQAVDEVLHATHSIRVRPFREACEQLPRTVRDLSTASGKSVSLIVHGGDVEVDGVVLDGLRDPLVQLVRNAVDHGIEAPAERAAAGKDQTGTVRIEARASGDQLVVEVGDDGAGLDVAALREAYRSRGRELPEGDEAVVEALLRGGVSTRARATTHSGRGVGLDIVREGVGGVRASLDLRWERGGGTSFLIRAPVSLATSRLLLARVHSWVMAFPTPFVERVLRPEAERVRRSRGREVLVTDDGTVPLAPLARILGPPFREPDGIEAARVVLLASGRLRAAVLVDELLREDEMVVRPATPGVKAAFVSAATVLPSGEVVPVLDVPALLAAGAEAAYGPELEWGKSPESAARRARVLVVDDSITTRTLERSIFESAGFDADAVADGADAWAALHERPYDLVVADVEMPRMDGFELCRSIRSSPRLREVPVVLVTARESPEDRQRGLDAGADAYVVKSAFDQADLLEIARQLLAVAAP